MAEQHHSLLDFKDQLDDQLTCSVCLDQYTNPKTLPCLHSFCLKCIEQIPVERKERKYYIRCPTCRVDHLLPRGGADSFPNAFQINSLFDLQKALAKNEIVTSSTSQQHTDILTSTCPKHNDLLTVYCETCDEVICRDCTISTEHNKHTFYLISECYPKHHQQIQDNLDHVRHKLDNMNIAMTHLDTREREVFEQGENIKEQIYTHAQQLIDNIQQSRTQLTQQVDTIVQRKTQTLAKQRQQAQKIHTQLKTCQYTIEHSLKEWNERKILSQKNYLINEMQETTKHVNSPAMFQPIEDANILYKKFKNELGSIKASVLDKATLEVLPCMAKQLSTATLTLHSQDGLPFSLPPSLISSTLSSPGNEHSEKCTIIQRAISKYKITFTPTTRNDQLIVQVGGVDVPDSPFTLPVLSPETKEKPIDIINGLKKPWGIAVRNNGDIVVAEHGGHCITILSKRGEKVKTFGKFVNPREVAISKDGQIIVTDDHRLQKVTTDGVCMMSVGSEESGSSRLQFNYPRGIAVDFKTGNIFVADNWNNRIQVFSNELTFLQSINSTLTLSHFNLPCDIAIDDRGFLYIAELGDHCITKLTQSTKTKRCIIRFGDRGSAPGQLNVPSFLTIHNDLVYVCEYGNNRVSVFDTDGKFRYYFGELRCPTGIAADTLGYLYVSDTDNNRIVVF